MKNKLKIQNVILRHQPKDLMRFFPFVSLRVRMTSVKGFTLIELLIVIAVIGVLSAGVLSALNVTSQIDKSNLAKAKTFSASVENSLSINQFAKWSFEEGNPLASPQTFASYLDSSGYNHTTGLSGWGSASAPTSSDTNTCGLGFGKCIQMVNSTDGLRADVEQNSNDFTIGAFVKYGTLTVNGAIIGQYRTGARGWIVGVRTNGHVWAKLDTGSGFVETADDGVVINDNKWHYITVVFNRSSGVKRYTDGTPTGTLLTGAGIVGSVNPSDPAYHPSIGRLDGDNQRYVGYIDELTIFQQALTMGEVKQLYAQNSLKQILAQSRF